MSAREIADFTKGAPAWDTLDATVLPVADVVPVAKPDPIDIGTALDLFYANFTDFLDPLDSDAPPTRASTAFLKAMQNPFEVQDSARALGGDLSSSPFDTMAHLSSKGFNRFGCSLRRSSQTIAVYGQEFFADADFVMVAHRLERKTWENADDKLFEAGKALILRGYTDEKTGRIARFQTTALPLQKVLETHPTCKAYLKPKPAQVASAGN